MLLVLDRLPQFCALGMARARPFVPRATRINTSHREHGNHQPPPHFALAK